MQTAELLVMCALLNFMENQPSLTANNLTSSFSKGSLGKSGWHLFQTLMANSHCYVHREMFDEAPLWINQDTPEDDNRAKAIATQLAGFVCSKPTFILVVHLVQLTLDMKWNALVS